MAEPLVAKSYLDSHVDTLLNGMNFRYETQVKTATDILSKVRRNLGSQNAQKSKGLDRGS